MVVVGCVWRGVLGVFPLTSGLCTDRDVACKDYATPSAACGRFGQPLPLCWVGPHGAASGVAEIRDGRHQFSCGTGRKERGTTFQKRGPYSAKTGFQSEKAGLLSSKAGTVHSKSGTMALRSSLRLGDAEARINFIAILSVVSVDEHCNGDCNDVCYSK